MLKQEYDSQMERLSRHYGVKFYAPQTIIALWDEYKDLPRGMFERVVNRCMLVIPVNRPPLAEQFDKFLAEMNWSKKKKSQKQIWILPHEKFPHVNCSICSGDGWVYMRRSQPGKRALLGVACCRCESGIYASQAPDPIQVSYDQAIGWGWSLACRFFGENIDKLLGEFDAGKGRDFGNYGYTDK